MLVLGFANHYQAAFSYISLDTPSALDITGAPNTAQLPGTVLRLTCRSQGTSPLTRLTWHLDNALMDSSYRIEGAYVVNEYNYTVPESGVASFECRLNYPPTGLLLKQYANITAIGSLAFLALLY